MGVIGVLRRLLLGQASSSVTAQPEFRCLRCGAEFKRQYNTCSECGAQFVAEIDTE